MKNFYYLIQRKTDGQKFIAHGNRKEHYIGLSYLFEFVNNDYPYAVKTPYGLIKNVSSDIKFDGNSYRIIHQSRI